MQAGSANNGTDTMRGNAQPSRELRLRMSGSDTKQQLVVLPTAERQREIGARNLTVRARYWNRPGIDFGTHAASFKEVAKVLQQSVAEVDHGRHGPQSGQPLAGQEPRAGRQIARHQMAARRAPRPTLSGQDSPAQRGIAESSSDENFIAGARSIPAQRSRRRVTEQSDRNCQLARRSYVAPDYIDPFRARSAAQAPIQPIEEAPRESGANCEVDYAGGGNPAHRGDIA